MGVVLWLLLLLLLLEERAYPKTLHFDLQDTLKFTQPHKNKKYEILKTCILFPKNVSFLTVSSLPSANKVHGKEHSQ